MDKRIKISVIILLFIFLSSSLVWSDSVWDYLTIGQADQRYCRLDGSCGTAGGANLTGAGSTGKIAQWNNATDIGYTEETYVSDTEFSDNNDTVTKYIDDSITINNATLKEYIDSNSTNLDNICDTDGKILKRIGGVWQCANDATGGVSGSGSVTNLNITMRLKEEAIYMDMYIPKLS